MKATLWATNQAAMLVDERRVVPETVAVAAVLTDHSGMAMGLPWAAANDRQPVEPPLLGQLVGPCAPRR